MRAHYATSPTERPPSPNRGDVRWFPAVRLRSGDSQQRSKHWSLIWIANVVLAWNSPGTSPTDSAPPVMRIRSGIEAMQVGILPTDDEGISALHTTTLRLGRLLGEIEMLAESEANLRRSRVVLWPLTRSPAKSSAAIAGAMEM